MGTVNGSRILTLWATVDTPFRLAPNGRRGHSGQVLDIAITTTGEKGVTTARDGTTKIWWLASGRMDHHLRTQSAVTGLFPGPDGAHVVTTGADGRAEVWNVGSGQSVAELDERAN